MQQGDLTIVAEYANVGLGRIVIGTFDLAQAIEAKKS